MRVKATEDSLSVMVSMCVDTTNRWVDSSALYLQSLDVHSPSSYIAIMHSEICINSMQVTVLRDAMKDDALNDRVARSESLYKRKCSIELNIDHF